MPVAFCAVISFPHPKISGWREHRLVCLPDYQGIGIGNKLSNYVARLFAASGKPYYSATSHPAIIGYRSASPDWQTIRKSSLSSGGSKRANKNLSKTRASDRLTTGFKYVGSPSIYTRTVFD